MRKFTYTLLALLFVFAFSVSAVTEYDIGGGLTLILYDDGSYKIIEGSDTSFLVGRQYVYDMTSSIQPLISLIIESDPTLAAIDPALLTELTLAYAENYLDYDISMQLIFISKTELIMTITSDGQHESLTLGYKLSPGGILTINDGSDDTYQFSNDYTSFELVSDGIFVPRFTLVK